MPPPPSRTASWILPCALLAAGCESAPGPDPGGEIEIAGVPQVLVTTESALIGALADMAVGADGRIFLLDAQARRVHVVDPAGGPTLAIGRPGEGPGELQRPQALYLRGDSLVVADQGTGRYEVFTLVGEATASRQIPPCASGPGPPALGADGTQVRVTLGFDEVLAVVCSPDGEERARIGELLAPGQSFVNMVELHEQILEGEVPALLVNAANAVVGRNGSVWLTVAAAARVERYAPDGERAFRIELCEPEFPATRAAWIQRAAEMEMPGIPGLNYLLRAREVGGDLWILTHPGGDVGAKIVVISPGGEVERRLRFPLVEGASNFAVDEQRGRIYFYLSDTAEVVGADLGAALEVTAAESSIHPDELHARSQKRHAPGRSRAVEVELHDVPRASELDPEPVFGGIEDLGPTPEHADP
jgi:sugar lactone lactonase YvrE